MVEGDKKFLIKKLDFSESDWQEYMESKVREFSQYKTNSKYIDFLIPLYHKIKKYT